MRWKGVWVAIVTPLRKDKVDQEALTRLVDHVLAGGIHGLCPCGTTGEGSSLTEEEFVTVVQTVIDRVKGRVPVVPGTGTNNTKSTVERTKLAKKLGADGALVVTPYYVKPTPEGLIRHYGEVAKVDLPILLYNVPGRTGLNMMPETVEKLTEFGQVKAIKECAPLPQVAELLRRTKSRIDILSGEDGVFLPFLALGGGGIVSVAANVVPDRVVAVYDAFERKDLAAAQEEFLKLTTLTDLLFVESNPIPAKAALAMMGLMTAEIRPPLAPMTETNAARLREELVRRGAVRA